ncbi:arginine--tRNA ligase [bacterium]|nr:arginine--tRNA ligase [bacterium]
MLIGILKKAVKEAIKRWGKIPHWEVFSFDITVPPSEKLGDYATNAALLLAKEVGETPQKVAEELLPYLEQEGIAERIEIARGGFINFFLKQEILEKVIRAVNSQGDEYGFPNIGGGKRVQIEFVSANPTGPLSVAHGRGAVIGDVLANLFSRLGYEVSREYYINDYGSQIDAFAKSIYARYAQLWGKDVPIPEDGYKGDYVKDLAVRIREELGDKLLDLSEENLRVFKERGVELMVDSHKRTLERFGVKFDNWFKESSLHKASQVQKTLEVLRDKGLIFEMDGALWFRSTLFGDDKDRVLVRSDGTFTYFAADLAYHRDKFERGFARVIDIWGPDHYGYVGRMMAGIRALGYGEEWLRILIFQVVRLVREGELIMMSKREGEFVTLDELVDEVGKDAARFFYLLRTLDSPLDFDMTLAVKQAPENPVYYVQYAHTRIHSILREAEKRGIELENVFSANLELLKEEKEKALIKKLGEFPTLVGITHSSLEPYNIVRYSLELAKIFHNFYEMHRVITDDEELTNARLQLMMATIRVLRNCLSLLGVEAPEKM